MSLLEHTIWTVLGYGAMPFIFLSGFVAVAVTCCMLLNAFGEQSAEKGVASPCRQMPVFGLAFVFCVF